MTIIIGSAKRDENGRYVRGKPGDQLQGKSPDFSGEVSMQSFYVAKKGWNVIRAKDFAIAVKIAANMKAACNNANIGYSQSDRYGVINNGINSKTPTNCDCSSLVRQCVKEATGKDPGDFTTANAVSKLNATGFFQKTIPYTPSVVLYTGDILCTKTKGHIVVVTDGNAPKAEAASVTKPSGKMKISQRGIDLIKKFEGCKLTAYKAVPTEQYYTIGIGHYGADVHPGMSITMVQAEEYLRSDISRFENAVNKTGLKLNQNQFDALVSFTYNCGEGNLKKLIQNRTIPQIADAIVLYNKSGGKVLVGLVNRRRAEKALFVEAI